MYLTDSEDPEAGTDNILFTGVHALKGAQSMLGVTPKVLIVPGFTHHKAVLTELVPIAERLKAVTVTDGPNTTTSAFKLYAKQFDSVRVYMVNPWVKVWDTTDNVEIIEPPSARVAGIISASDQKRGFWYSPSNVVMNGITGLSRPVDFALNDPNCETTLLNEANVAIIIHDSGYRLWGNRSCSTNTKWAFLCVRCTLNMVLQAQMWAVDRPITRALIEEMVKRVNAYLRTLKSLGAILGGNCLGHWGDRHCLSLFWWLD